MITSQIIQNSIDELSAITRVQLCVYDLKGKVVASTSEITSFEAGMIADFASSPVDSQVIGNNHLLKILDEAILRTFFSPAVSQMMPTWSERSA